MFPLVKVSASKYLYMLKSMCTFSLLIYMGFCYCKYYKFREILFWPT